jgi:hypothetical protein
LQGKEKREIHIIMPRPNEFDYNSLNHIFSKEQLYHFTLVLIDKTPSRRVENREIARYIPLRFQSWFLNDFM